MKHYIKVFGEGKIEELHSVKKGSVMHARFSLNGQELMASDSDGPHKFTFSEGISLIIPCSNQKEMDKFYSKLSAVPSAEVCGWLKDKYGVSWQLVPKDLDRYMSGKNAKHVMAAVMKMRRLDMAKLKKVHEG
jgi:predicted 3-demethylubiquinone-9 3-methyltransferase (glyoxalase superfamily)